MKHIKLKFNGPFHLGRGLPNDYGSSEVILHSDTIKAALFSMAVRLDISWANKSRDFHHAFFVSTAYPYYRETYFFPRPLHIGSIDIEGMGEMEARKIQKGIKYIDKPLFEMVLNGEPVPVISEDQIMDKAFAFSKSLSHPTTKEKFFATEVQQRVRVGSSDTEEVKTLPYFTDRIYLNEEAGYFILLDFVDPENKEFSQFLLACFRLLGDEGIGTDRSSGNGMFEVLDSEFAEFNLTVPENSQNYMTMGLFCPSENDLKAIKWDQSFWTIFKRGGYMGGSSIPEFYRIKKNAVNMIGEGSILNADDSLSGKMVNLRPKWDTEDMHDVWRDGRSINLPIIIQ